MRYFFRFFNLPRDQADHFFDQVHKISHPDDEDISYRTFVRLLWPYIVPGVAHPSLPGARDDETEESNGRGWQAKDKLETIIHGLNDDKALQQSLKDIGDKLTLKFKHCRNAFRHVDINCDGKVCQDELRNFFRIFGWPEDVADRLYFALDKDESGTIDYNEFVNIFKVGDGHMFAIGKHV